MVENLVKVLVVDDEAAMRRGICVSLKARGYAVEEARTGNEAIEAFHERHPDLVLLDINMPGMGGIETCRCIRAEAPNADRYDQRSGHRRRHSAGAGGRGRRLHYETISRP